MEKSKAILTIFHNLKFSVIEYKFDYLKPALKFIEQNDDITPTNSRIFINHIQFTVEELKAWKQELNPKAIKDLGEVLEEVENLPNSTEVKVTSFYDNQLNEHTWSSIAEAVEFFEDEPLGRLTSAVIKVNGVNINKQELYAMNNQH